MLFSWLPDLLICLTLYNFSSQPDRRLEEKRKEIFLHFFNKTSLLHIEIRQFCFFVGFFDFSVEAEQSCR